MSAILQFLKFHRIPAWRMSVGATKIDQRFVRFGVPGMSDIIGMLPRSRAITYAGNDSGMRMVEGRFLAIEVKSPRGRVSPAQQAFLDTVNASGGKAFVARSVDDVRRELGL